MNKKAHTHKNNDNLCIQNQVGNVFSLNLFLWQYFLVSSSCLLRMVGLLVVFLTFQLNTGCSIFVLVYKR